MLTNKLTDLKIRKAKHAEKAVKLADGGALYLELHPNGSRYWRMKYRFGGAEKRLAFGVYPEVSLPTRASAETKHASSRQRVLTRVTSARPRRSSRKLGQQHRGLPRLAYLAPAPSSMSAANG